MYWLFVLHNISPVEVHKMTRRERKILFAFQRAELEDRKAEAEKEEQKINDMMENIKAGR